MLAEIEILINQYYKMSDGENIDNYQDILEFTNGEIFLKLKKKVLKHIVEKRKADSYSTSKLVQLFIDLQKNLENKFYQIIPNTNENVNSLLFVEDDNFIGRDEGVVMALEIIKLEENIFYIKTGFYRSIAKIKKLLQQK